MDHTGFLDYRNGVSFKRVENENSKVTLWFSVRVTRATDILFAKVARQGPKVRRRKMGEE